MQYKCRSDAEFRPQSPWWLRPWPQVSFIARFCFVIITIIFPGSITTAWRDQAAAILLMFLGNLFASVLYELMLCCEQSAGGEQSGSAFADVLRYVRVGLFITWCFSLPGSVFCCDYSKHFGVIRVMVVMRGSVGLYRGCDQLKRQHVRIQRQGEPRWSAASYSAGERGR